MQDLSLRELCAEVREVKADLRGLRDLMNERDKRYSEVDKASKEAVQAALAAAEKAVQAALAAAEKAAEKTEAALKEYKTGANEWRDTVKDLIGNLRESRSEAGGGRQQQIENRAQSHWVIGLGIGVVLAIPSWIGMAVLLFKLMGK